MPKIVNAAFKAIGPESRAIKIGLKAKSWRTTSLAAAFNSIISYHKSQCVGRCTEK